MRLQAHFESQDQERREQRASVRRALRLDLAGHVPVEGEVAVTIRDLSLTGLLIETAAPLDCGDSFHIELPEGGLVEARIVWTGGHLFGCQFDRPISPAALSAAILKGEARPSEPAGQRDPADVLAALREITAHVQAITAKVERSLSRLEEDRDDKRDR